VQSLVCAAEQKLGRADADFVKDKTGFAIGGVSPIGHLNPPVCLIDQDLARFDVIWAAAGHPHAVFKLSMAQLQVLTLAPVCDVAQSVGA
jgi:prolyl-tRNA editing enzyme YbaK/EbsC (Cys-tRNA(Pro) deacylase)